MNTLQDLANTIAAKLHAHSFTHVTTDSRSVTPGCLFVAIKGEKFDGHDFIEQACAKGALGILCKASPQLLNVRSSYSQVEIFEAEDTLMAFRALAASWRKYFSIPVIVVAGSAGKTTTKELLASMLCGKWPHVLKTSKSQNGFLGVAMTLLELRPEQSAAVIEVGIDAVGSMKQHLDIIAPTASLLTSVGEEHLEFLKDVPTVAKEEGLALSEVAAKGGIVCINLDDPWIAPYAKSLNSSHSACIIPFSAEGALSADGRTVSHDGVTYALPLPGGHNASNFMAALCMALAHGLTSEEIQRGLKTFQPADGRSVVKTLPGPITVLCDYYNAQPPSMAAALKLFGELHRKPGRLIACLADMRELGNEQEKYHRNLAEPVLRLNVDHVLLTGPQMVHLADELQKRSFQGQCRYFENRADLIQALLPLMQPGDTLLIKGSNSMRMEEVWQALTREK